MNKKEQIKQMEAANISSENFEEPIDWDIMSISFPAMGSNLVKQSRLETWSSQVGFVNRLSPKSRYHFPSIGFKGP